MLHKIKRCWRAVCRALAYAKFGLFNPDWDHTFFYALLQFKFERMQKAFENDPTVSAERTKSIRVAHKLAKRLTTENYRRALDAHDRKWGELEMTFGPADKNDMREAIFKRKKVTTRTAKKEKIEFMAAVDADDRAHSRDIKRLTDIINKYSQHWWS